jgi:hypothetical protein
VLILALDPATRTGYTVGAVGADKPTLGTVNFGGRLHDDHADIFARALRWIELQFSSRSVFGVPGVLAIEEPVAPWQVQGETQYAATKIALGLQAIFQGAARAQGIQIITAPVRTWRKYALGAGNMKGADAKRAIMRLAKQLGWWDESLDHNAAEACGIWLYACGQCNPKLALRPEPLFVGRG